MHNWLGTLLRPRRLLAVGVALCITSVLVLLAWQSSTASLLARTGGMALAGLLVHNTLEHWPRSLPARVPRWLVQLLGVTLVLPVVVTAFYLHATEPGAPPFWREPLRMAGFGMLCFIGVTAATWTLLVGMVVAREAELRQQALRFALERSELERRALDARLRLVQAQVEPHFIFNTLANVRALVDGGSPQASPVLGRLIAYLRAALPRLDPGRPTLAHELDIVRPYLDLMQMRMPDRLQVQWAVDDAALPLHCPPLTLMTLVENAVRHGIDPSEEGGMLHIEASAAPGQPLRLRVRDSGVGLGAGNGGGTGLSALRERLQLAFAGAARLNIREVAPHGVLAEVELPAQTA